MLSRVSDGYDINDECINIFVLCLINKESTYLVSRKCIHWHCSRFNISHASSVQVFK